MARTENEYAGRVIITWPQSPDSLIHGAVVKLTDADNGQPILSALDLTVTVKPDSYIVAEMTMLTGEDGQPLAAGMTPTREGDTIRTGQFRWIVAEMRTAAPDQPTTPPEGDPVANTVRAKFQCNSVEQFSPAPRGGIWHRTFKFQAVYDTTVPEDQRYATATPSGELRLSVDNPNVSFEPGKAYYLDFTPAEDN
jgi:hypothetical protein